MPRDRANAAGRGQVIAVLAVSLAIGAYVVPGALGQQPLTHEPDQPGLLGPVGLPDLLVADGVHRGSEPGILQMLLEVVAEMSAQQLAHLAPDPGR